MFPKTLDGHSGSHQSRENRSIHGTDCFSRQLSTGKITQKGRVTNPEPYLLGQMSLIKPM